MSLQRCYTLSVSRPIRKFTTYSIIRFISNNIVINNCSAKVIDNNLNTVKIEQSDIPSECEKLKNGGYVSQIQSNLNANVNTVSSVHIQQINSNLPSDDYLEDSDITLPHPLDTCTEDVSDIGPPLTPTFTFAKYANKSNTIQELVKLGVHLYKFESQEGMLQYILSLDFERDVKPYIRFLHDCGVPADYLGTFITKHPNIFKENMDDLYTRIRYLRAHEFNTNMISTIICKNPMWLSYKTTDIDGRLAYFQSNFKLKGHEVRMLTVKGPKVVTYRMTHLFANTYTIKEEMGFDQWQMKALLLRMPRIWTKNRERLLAVFEYAHDEMQLQHDFLTQTPHIFLCRKSRLVSRHLFLVKMNKAQYDPKKPMYISPQVLVSGTDADFCRDIAKASVDVYNEFLKTF